MEVTRREVSAGLWGELFPMRGTASPRANGLSYGALLLLYLMGWVFWSDFFNRGVMLFSGLDWAEKRRALEMLAEGLRQGFIPYHVTARLSDWHSTKRLLAQPHLILSPQIVLLQWMDAAHFLLCNARLMYSAGFAGCLLLARRLRLSLAPFAVFWLLFNFNGYITAHLGVGHTEWFAYFLLPWLLAYALDLRRAQPVSIATLAIGMIQFVMILQGGFHFAVWFMLLLVLIWIFEPNRRLFRVVAFIAAETALLAAFRVAPAAITFAGEQLPYVAGYPTPGVMLNAFVLMQGPAAPPHPSLFTDISASWWEYDMYIGEIAFAFLLFFGIGLRFWRAPWIGRYRFKEFDLPLAIFTLLAFGHLYYLLFLVTFFPILGNAERVPSRFIILPVLFLAAFACARFQGMLNQFRGRIAWKYKLLGGLLLAGAAVELYAHAQLWCVRQIDQTFTVPPKYPVHATVLKDPVYLALFWIGAAVSAGSFAAWLFLLKKTIGRERDRADQVPAQD